MSWDDEAREIERLRALAAMQGGAEAVAKQHARGRQSVRERIDALVDKGSFREQGGLAGEATRDEGGRLTGFTPSNAVIGSARIDGRPVVVCGDDFTVRGGAYSPAGMKKAEYADRLALSRRVPNVRLLEAGGASVSGISGVRGRSGYDFVGGATSNSALVEVRAHVPMVAAALGPVAGFAAARLCAAHFSLMTRNAQVLIGGPALVARAKGEEVSKEELGGVEIHARSGVVDNIAEDEADAWRQIRRFLSYLPSNVWEAAPALPCDDPRERRDAMLVELVPRDGRKPYKMRRLVEAVVDRESFFELTPGFGRTQITGLARVNGQPVGVFANDPYVYGGSMTA
ncbi:MAG TPA: carboxyl transferase domain-containing protein, partial [Myxococcota bacterium]|nr:carboxyl transferase domain-containing protein [Myxococcota bacterium]